MKVITAEQARERSNSRLAGIYDRIRAASDKEEISLELESSELLSHNISELKRQGYTVKCYSSKGKTTIAWD